MQFLTSLSRILHDTSFQRESERHAKIENVIAQYSDARRQHQKELASLDYGNQDSPIIKQAKAFSNSTIQHLDQLGTLLENTRDTHAELMKKSSRAKIKRNILGLIGAVTGSFAAIVLLPSLPLMLATMLVIGAATAGIAAGKYMGNNLWVKPIDHEFNRFKDTGTEQMLQLQLQGEQIEKAGKEEMERLNTQIRQASTSRAPQSHIHALESERKATNTINR